MPIDYRQYPADWKQIRARILDRAGNRCEWSGCGVPNRAWIIREGDQWRTVSDWDVDGFTLDGEKVVCVVLTIAHLCHDPACADESHLQALCQLHHNRLDFAMRQKHAAETRRRKRIAAGQLGLEPADAD